ncbi:hypothetical protein EV182_002809 [Spiromyces aspiralis]|uniref:Uncharacterized protein n=1 Tax=Spiromyces aspiralis TaxID=68401 RepID=A0ACC1HF87_9FUNG|nr:hypothetical protein EV182_002809 [Spiromyces aspiralis]
MDHHLWGLSTSRHLMPVGQQAQAYERTASLWAKARSEATDLTARPGLRLVIAASLFLVTFLAAMDQMIVAVVLSTLTKEFDAMSSSAWIGTAYLLTMAAFQPLYGKLSDIFGRL